MSTSSTVSAPPSIATKLPASSVPTPSPIAEMARYILPDFPVLPGKKQLTGWCGDFPDQSRLDEDRCQGKARWKSMTAAKSIVDFERWLRTSGRWEPVHLEERETSPPRRTA